MDLSKLYDNGKLRIPPKPLMFFLDLTEKCNLNCWFCYNDINGKKENANFNDIIKIIEIMCNAGSVEVIYLGGEPTLHPRLFEILHYAEALKMNQCIISNGQLITSEFAKKISGISNLQIGISIHSHNDIIQNSISGYKNSFRNLEQTIRLLEEYNISWYSQTSLIKSNYLFLGELRKFLLKNGNPKRMDFSRMIVGKLSKEQFLMENEYIQVFKQINEFDTDKLPIRIEAFPRCWLKKICNDYGFDYEKIKKTVRPCYAWITQISIDIHGNVRLCPTGGMKAGNILEQGIDKIWEKSKNIRFFQSFSWQRKECLECDEFVFCVGACKMTCIHCCPSPDNYIIKGGMNYASIAKK